MNEHKDCSAATEHAPLRLEWRDGAPPKPWSQEWFIAETTFGDRVCLKALPDEWTYDFKTADDTYIKADKIKRWMQFPDSEFVAPNVPVVAQAVRMPSIEELREAIADGWSLGNQLYDDFDETMRLRFDAAARAVAALAAQPPAAPVNDTSSLPREGQNGAQNNLCSNCPPVGYSTIETCFDCGVREPCDEDCPNQAEPEPVTRSSAGNEGVDRLSERKLSCRELARYIWDRAQNKPDCFEQDIARLIENERKAAVSRAQPQEAWQPIETIPKDGLIDIWTVGYGAEPHRVSDCYYDSICDEWRTSRPAGQLMCIKRRYITHWMPRPGAPLSRPQGATPSAPDASTPAQRPRE